MSHNCKLTDKDGFYTFTCSRCRACYVCKHKAVYFDEAGKWMWKCRDGKFREVILDGRIQS
jgi:MinD superfamily P-loop ATPase